MSALLQLTCILAEIGACVAFWTWRFQGRRRAMLATAALLAAIAGAVAAWLYGVGEARFPIAMLGGYLLAGLCWAAAAGRGPSRWSLGEGGVLAMGVALTAVGCA